MHIIWKAMIVSGSALECTQSMSPHLNQSEMKVRDLVLSLESCRS